MPEATDLERTQALIGMLENSLENWRESDGKYGRSDSEREAARRKRATMLRQLQSLVGRGPNSGEGHDVKSFGEGQFITAKTVWFEAPEGGDFFILSATTDVGAFYIEMDVNSQGYDAPLYQCDGASSPSISTCTYTWTPTCVTNSWVFATTTYSALFASNLATETDADGGECNPLEPV